MFNDGTTDVIKKPHKCKTIIKENITCTIPDCDELLTLYEGPGESVYCRNHQLEQVEYGGYGRSGRNHTFHRSDTCDCCGHDINNDPRLEKCAEKFGELDEKQLHQVKRRYNHGDHDTRKADGGSDSADNINAYCSFCHWYKTVKNEDGRRSASVD